jgi:hypothetical protein
MTAVYDEPSDTLVSSDEREEIMNRTLQRSGANGWRIESRSRFQATIAQGKDTNHVLHLILSIVTLGAWLLVWALVAILGGLNRRLLSVDEFGNVLEQKL